MSRRDPPQNRHELSESRARRFARGQLVLLVLSLALPSTVVAASPELLIATQPGSSAGETPPPQVDEPPTLRPYQVHLLRQWYKKVGKRKADETFGDLVVRAGRLHLGEPYGGVFKTGGSEQLRVSLSRFECVSFVETSLAVARCVWMETPDEECFAKEVVAFRYRDGELSDYASRLHYFTDWIGNNADRRRVEQLTASLGGTPVEQPFNFMTENAHQFDGLEDPTQLVQIQAVEARLSAQVQVILEKDAVSGAQHLLQSGDLLAVVSDKLPGLMVGHVGFVDRKMGGKPRFLHASSYHERVVLTIRDVARYTNGQAHRIGLIVVRPVPPERTGKLARLDGHPLDRSTN